jgi:hypothetical protein
MFTFNKNYFGVAALIFAIEVMIALFVRDSFVRPYLGDVLVVILIYSFIKAFLDFPVLPVAIFVLLFAFTIELLQYIHIVEILGLRDSKIVSTVLGTSFAWYDMFAYIAGFVIILIGERMLAGKK